MFKFKFVEYGTNLVVSLKPNKNFIKRQQAHVCKRLRNPEIDSKELNVLLYVYTEM
jgi:hypothetical protein